MDLGLQGRTAFVAGASSGLGLAVARELAREGCRVTLCSRDAARIDAAAAHLVATTGVDPATVLSLPCDVTDESAIQQALARATDTFGPLNILVTNAGGPPTGQVDDFQASDWEAAIRLNLLSTINLTRHALPSLRQAAATGNPLGRVIMISSISAKQPISTLYLSNVARAGVQGFAKSLAEELGPAGITVNTVLPGYTRTDRLQHLASSLHVRTGRSMADIEAGWAASSALKRIGTEEEFAAAVAFLASARASYITGVALSIDGGATKGLL
jgi:3-oxoacyl-[acyl-carrier protein] reductase